MRVKIIGLLLTSTAILLTSPSYAGGPTIRANDRDGSTRLVMEWDAPPVFQQKSIDEKTVELSFSQSITPDLSALKKLNGLSDIRIVSEPNQPTRLWLSLSKAGEVRSFAAGNRLIIDIPQDPDFKKVENEIKVPAPAAIPVQAVEAAPVSNVVSVKQTEVPAPQTTQPAVTPNVTAGMIEVTNTEQIPVASYARDDRLNVIIDQPDFTVPPQFVTDTKSQVKSERYSLPLATGFSYPYSKNVSVTSQGGGLSWKLFISNKPQSNAKIISPKLVNTPDGRSVLQFKLPTAKRVIETRDERRGQKIYIIPVAQSTDSVGAARRYTEFETLLSPVGLAIASKVDDLSVTIKDGIVTVSRPKGLSLSSLDEMQKFDASLRETKMTTPEVKPLTEPPPSVNDAAPAAVTTSDTRIFRFDRWDMGGPKALETNTQILLSGVGKHTDDDRVQDMLTLAKLNLANGRGIEALGFLDLALEKMPILSGNPEFLALRGASRAIAGQYDQAYVDIASPKLDSFSEINIWRAFVLSNLQDWKQAAEKMPATFELPAQYPAPLRDPIIIAMAEIALRAGNIELAEKALSIAKKNSDDLSFYETEHLKYLDAELARQKGDKQKAKEIWTKLTKSKDDYFRARGGMALASLLIDGDEIKPEDAVDKLEGLRFSWRGDELEASVNQKLGEMYLDAGETLKGLGVLRTAATLLPGSDTSRRITEIMASAFKELFLGDAIAKANPMDVVTIHEEFPELLPVGDEGDKVTEALVDRLVQVDLTPRAAKILQSQIDNRLTGEKAADAGLRLASLYLLDQKPNEALVALKKVQDSLSADAAKARMRDITLLKAKALSQLKQPEQAFEMLSDLPQDYDVLSLKADIAWQTGRWTEASAALADIVFQEDIQPTRPPTDDQANMLLNWAVAMNLAGDRSGLASLREKYGDLMKQTAMNDTFEVVTRPRQATLLADRDTLNNMISEVDLFKDFLSAYRAKPAAKAVAPKPAEKPAEVTPATATESAGQ